MKRFGLSVAAGLLCLSAFGVRPASAAGPADVNGDNTVNVADALLALRASVQLDTLTPSQEAVADLSPRPGTDGRLYGDGRVDVQDAIRILQYIVGLLTLEEVAPAEPLALYTLNAGAGCSENPSATRVDLTRFFTTPQDAVNPNAFPTGKLPNHMVVRGETGYVANSLSNSLQIIDLKTHTVETVDLGEGTNPMQVAVLGEKAYVSLLLTNEVAVVNLTTRQVIERITVGSGPTGVAVTGGKVYVTNTAFNIDTFGYDPGTVSVIDPATDTVIDTLPVPVINPQDMAVDPWGLLHVVSTGNYFDIPGAVTVYNPSTDRQVGTIPVGGAPGGIAITFGGKAYLADTTKGLLSYNARTYTLLRGADQPISLGAEVWDVASDARGRLYVVEQKLNKVAILDTRNDQPIGEIPTGPCPGSVTVL